MAHITPFEPLRRLSNYTLFPPSLSRAMHDFLDDLGHIWAEPSRLGLFAREEMRLDVQENETNYVIHAEVPGYAKDDIQIDLDDRQVTIRAQKTEKPEQATKRNGGEHVILCERAQTGLYRTLQLPSDISEEGASAKCENGMLELVLPKRNGAKTRHLPVM